MLSGCRCFYLLTSTLSKQELSAAEGADSSAADAAVSPNSRDGLTGPESGGAMEIDASNGSGSGSGSGSAVIDSTKNNSTDRSTAVEEEDEPLSAAEQKATLAKVTARIIPYVSVLYMLCFLDRANIGSYGVWRSALCTGVDYV